MGRPNLITSFGQHLICEGQTCSQVGQKLCIRLRGHAIMGSGTQKMVSSHCHPKAWPTSCRSVPRNLMGNVGFIRFDIRLDIRPLHHAYLPQCEDACRQPSASLRAQELWTSASVSRPPTSSLEPTLMIQRAI